MGAQITPTGRDGLPVVLGAALCGFAGSLLPSRLPLAPLPRVAVALLVGACTAAVTAVAVQPQQELPGAEAAAGAAAADQQEGVVGVAAPAQQQLHHVIERARLEAQLGINEAMHSASPAERAKVCRRTLVPATLPAHLEGLHCPRHTLLA
jgi:hypothetical protein